MPSYVVSFRASDFDRAKTRAILNSYVDYERARAIRRTLVLRLFLFVLAAAVLTWAVPAVSPEGFAILCAMAATIAGAALVREIRIRRRFARESGLS